jgi:hypothetical protein
MKSTGVTPPSTWAVCRDIYQREGIRGLNKGANAVALRQMTGWASRIGLTRVNESFVRWATGKGQGDKLSAGEKIFSSCAGGALSCWNQPFEVRNQNTEHSLMAPRYSGSKCSHSSRPPYTKAVIGRRPSRPPSTLSKPTGFLGCSAVLPRGLCWRPVSRPSWSLEVIW